jgi:hypothetical protein
MGYEYLPDKLVYVWSYLPTDPDNKVILEVAKSQLIILGGGGKSNSGDSALSPSFKGPDSPAGRFYS